MLQTVVDAILVETSFERVGCWVTTVGPLYGDGEHLRFGEAPDEVPAAKLHAQAVAYVEQALGVTRRPESGRGRSVEPDPRHTEP